MEKRGVYDVQERSMRASDHEPADSGVKRSQVQEQMERLYNATLLLNDRLVLLTERLGPVTRAEPTPSVLENREQSLVPMANDLRQYATLVELAISYVMTILGSLEL